MWQTIFLLILVVFVYLWYTNTHIKEEAFKLAQAATAENSYQLLDDTIALSQFRILKHGRSFFLMRRFEFHYADQNDHRHVGEVIRYGKGWLNIEFDQKVISFPGAYAHD